MNQSSRNHHPPPASGGDRQHGGNFRGGGGGGRGGEGSVGRRRPYPAFAVEERNNFNERRSPTEHAADDRPGNFNWGQGCHPNYRDSRGGGGGGGGGGRGRPFQPPTSEQYQHRDLHHHHHSNSDPLKPLPPDQRRTLVLANVPPHIKHFHIKTHFQHNWGVSVKYAHVDKHSGQAYVRFETVDDAKRVWAGGTNGLDGPNYHSSKQPHADGSEQCSFVSEGVLLQEVYFTNFVPNDSKKYDDKQSTVLKKHSRGGDEYGGRERGGSHPDERDSKLPRLHSYQNSSADQGMSTKHDKKPAPSITNQSNNSYHRTSDKKEKQQQHHQLTPEELEVQKQKREEYQKQYEAFQKEEQEWRKRRLAEYQSFITAKNERTAQLATLQQKRDLQSQQESMLVKQLPLHKKMLSVLKSKDAPASEQSKKMKEILNTQTQLLELKKEMKINVEELEMLREEERVKGAFVPSEKRPVFAANGTGLRKRKLDRRTTVLRVEGFGEENVNDDLLAVELKEHFSAFGASDVTLERENVQDDDVSASVFALVHFSTRLDAEKAKCSGTNFREVPLKCSWHHEPSSSIPGDGSDVEGDVADSIVGTEEAYLHDNLYGDAEESYGDYFAGQGLPAGEEHDIVDYDYGGDEDMVDYD